MTKQRNVDDPLSRRVVVLTLEYLVLLAIVALVIVTAIREPSFLTSGNIANIMRQFGPLSFIALGMTFIIIGGFIDLSIPGMISMVTMITLSLFDVIGELPAMFVGMALGIAMGCLNGFVLVSSGATTQAKALFITFGMSRIYGAVSQIYTDGAVANRAEFIRPTPITNALSQGTVSIPTYIKTNIGTIEEPIIENLVIDIPISFFVFLAFLLVLFIFQKNTTFGRSISYTGGNILAAELGGIRTKRIMILIYALCGFMTAIGSIVLFSRVPVAIPLLGANFERDSIMAVVVGGTSLLGGKGSVLRTVLGVSLIILMANCMDILGIKTHNQEIFRGGVLVVAIWLDHRRHAMG